MAVTTARRRGAGARPAVLWGVPLLMLVLAGGYGAGRIAGPVAPGLHRTGQEPAVTSTTPSPSGGPDGGHSGGQGGGVDGEQGGSSGMPGMEGLARPDGTVGRLR